MKEASAKQLGKTRPHNICLLEGCDRTTVGSERLCVIHYYQLPRATRQALATQDSQTEKRDHRLVTFVLGGLPLEHIHIV